MRASTLPIAITLALVSQPALPFDQDEFCDSVMEVAQRMNARRGRWLDRSTRQDGVAVDCESKTLEANRFVNANPGDMREVGGPQTAAVERSLLQARVLARGHRQWLEHHLDAHVPQRRTRRICRRV